MLARNLLLFPIFASLVSFSGSVQADPIGLPQNSVFETDVLRHQTKTKGSRHEDGPTVCYRIRIATTSADSVRLSLRFVAEQGCAQFRDTAKPLFDDDVLISGVPGACNTENCAVFLVLTNPNVNRDGLEEVLAKLNFSGMSARDILMGNLGEATGPDGFLVYPLFGSLPSHMRTDLVIRAEVVHLNHSGFEIQGTESSSFLFETFSHSIGGMHFRFHSVP